MVQPMELTEEGEDAELNQEESFLGEDSGGRREASSSSSGDNTHQKILEACQIYCASYRGVELSFCLVLLIAGLLLEFLAFEPRQRRIPFQQLESTGEFILNQVYDETFDREIVPDGILIIISAVLPLLCQMILGYFSDSFNPHQTFCVYLAAIGLTLLLTDAIKVYVGYLRPIFFDLCIPDDKYQTCTSGDDDDARQSFPSGHSSLSFCGLGLFSFYLEERFGVSKLRQHSIVAPSESDHRPHQTTVGLTRIFSIISMLPLLLAGYIATSRIVDNHHFPVDVVGGSILGFSIALWIHNIWNERL